MKSVGRGRMKTWTSKNTGRGPTTYSSGNAPYAQSLLCLKLERLTVLGVIRVCRQAQGGSTVVAFEAATVEELALGTQPLHHVDPLLAEIAHVAAPQVLRELLLDGALWGGRGHVRAVAQAHLREADAQPSWAVRVTLTEPCCDAHSASGFPEEQPHDCSERLQ